MTRPSKPKIKRARRKAYIKRQKAAIKAKIKSPRKAAAKTAKKA